MKFLFKYLIVVGSCVVAGACQKKEKTPAINVTEKNDARTKYLKSHDTVLEPNNPKFLDLNKHQLFRDTTRTSQFYEKLLNWQPSLDSESLNYFYSGYSNTEIQHVLELETFPKFWVYLDMLDGAPVVYDPCNGQTEAVMLHQTGVLFIGVLEGHGELVSKVHSVTSDSVVLELKTLPQKSHSEKALFKILPTKDEAVYELIYTLDDITHKNKIIPIEKVIDYDLIVNHCPERMRQEYTAFD